MIETAVRTKLREAPAILDRVYFVMAPKKADPPFALVSLLSKGRASALGGAIGQSRSRIRVTFFAKTYKEVSELAAAARDRLEDFRGLVGAVSIQATTVETEVDGFDEKDRSYMRTVDFMISHREA